MKEIEAPKISVPNEPVNGELWRLVAGTLKTGRAVEVETLEEAGFSSVQSLRVAARKRAQRLHAKAHVSKTGTGYAVWYTK